ncbi:Pol polyprotein [Elysia marginata]|uniref:Pol polyprotein n=1 Tax=Elysia marginata TaxID=1093978 RepID=A0AAV4H7R4_9GAST|nr:Pol polyprotein [Elysia marginata]
MPFGLKNGAQTFQRLMDTVLQGLTCAFVYLDDILVASSSEQEHLKDIRSVCSRLQDAGLVIKLGKCLFGKKSLEFLGHQVSRFGSIPLPSKVKAISDFPKPTSIKGPQEFLGMINFYHRLIPQAASLLLPLHDALRKPQRRQIIGWTTDMDHAFTSCKAALADAIMLSHPNPMHKSPLPQMPLIKLLGLYWNSTCRACGSLLHSSANGYVPLNRNVAHLIANSWGST